MRQVGRSVQCRQNRRGRTAVTWPFRSFAMVNKRLETSDDLDVSQKTSNYRREAFGVPSACR